MGDSRSAPLRRWLWTLLTLAGAVDLLFVATSVLHTLAERGVDVGFGFAGMHVEDEFGAPTLWQMAKSGLAAVVAGVGCLRTRRWTLLPWVAALALIATSLATRFQDDVVASPTVGAALVGILIVALALVGRRLEANSRDSTSVAAAFVVFVIAGGALDTLHDILLDSSVEPVLSILEGGVELLLLTLACVMVVGYVMRNHRSVTSDSTPRIRAVDR
ncbi:MAG: hypothetical protein WA964_19840 [Ilumatobacter sp.]|uniref:hypothetical protein n=1 Tax=Ilumatobacter sp. TaxID=1967498 RepID=UPI003C754D5C